MTPTGRYRMEKQELARTVVKHGADMFRLMRIAEEVDDGPLTGGESVIESTATGLLAAAIQFSDTLDQYEELILPMEQQEQHVA